MSTSTKSSSVSRFFRSLKFSSTSTAASSPPSPTSATGPGTAKPARKLKPSSTSSSSSSSSSLGSLVAFTGRLFRKPRPDPREIVFTETHLQHQQMLSSFTMSFGRRGSWATCDREGISPCTSRVHLPLEEVDPLQP